MSWQLIVALVVGIVTAAWTVVGLIFGPPLSERKAWGPYGPSPVSGFGTS